MTNNERAKALAGIFGWEARPATTFDGTYVEVFKGPFWGDAVSGRQMFDAYFGLLPWLLAELVSKGHCVLLEGVNSDAEWIARIDRRDGHLFRGVNADPLLALVDACIMAHAEARK